MRIHTGMGTTPTILVIVVASGDGRLRGGELCAALRVRPARVARTGVTGIPAAGATAPRENAAGVARLAATRRWACRRPRTACGERAVTAGRDGTTACGEVVAVGVVAVAGMAMGVRIGGAGVAAALPEAADGAARDGEWGSAALPCGTCDVAGLPDGTCDVAGLPGGTFDVAGLPVLSCP